MIFYDDFNFNLKLGHFLDNNHIHNFLTIILVLFVLDLAVASFIAYFIRLLRTRLCDFIGVK